jgi:general secretion pathway protein K
VKSPARQTGVALITAILLVAIATALATKLTWDNLISMRRTETVLGQEQARFFAMGAEAVAIDVMRQDDAAFDHQAEDWAQITPPVEIGIDELALGQMQGRIIDAQARFNLNSLVSSQGTVVNTRAREQLERLIEILQLDLGLVDAIIDWIDADTIPLISGAEDDAYTSLVPPYRSANNYFASVSELRSVAGMDAESYAALLPHVTALDPGWCGARGFTPVNINTASAELIAALDKSIDIGQAEAWVEQRSEVGWENWNEIPDWPTALQPLQDTEISLKSSCFEVNVLVNIGSSVLSMYSLLDRSKGGDAIITRFRTFGLE